MKALFAAASVVALMAGAPAWAQVAMHQVTTHPHSLASQDREFMVKAGDGSLAEVQLGTLAAEKSSNPAVQEFGRWMVTDHSLANKRLTTIAQELGQPELHPTLTRQDIAVKDKLQGLSGSRFNWQYLQIMVKDHKKDVQLFRKEAQEGQKPQLKRYAQNLLPVLQQHLAEAEELSSLTGATATGSSINPHRR
ncbi:MAG TPA: DUF4142 domain-containing protein [Stellaceae bacterium]|nr:DUF4142 domain-containing protein [Stellaceae bacterium]